LKTKDFRVSYRRFRFGWNHAVETG
jgi:hypothetical protein